MQATTLSTYHVILCLNSLMTAEKGFHVCFT